MDANTLRLLIAAGGLLFSLGTPLVHTWAMARRHEREISALKDRLVREFLTHTDFLKELGAYETAARDRASERDAKLFQKIDAMSAEAARERCAGFDKVAGALDKVVDKLDTIGDRVTRLEAVVRNGSERGDRR